jgi:hypothetical protein
MAVTFNTGTVTPVAGAEQDVVAIAPGSPLDILTVYVEGGTGGAGGPLEFALYATVGGFRTRVAQKKILGSDTPSIIDFDTGLGPLSGGSGGAGQTEQIDAGGTAYTLTVIDLSGSFATSPRNPVTATIAAVNKFDTVADQNFGMTFGLAGGATGTLPLFNGYAQFMDVAIDQTNLPPVTVEVVADCGPGSVQAVVVSVNMTGQDEDIASVFRGIQLPAATRYFVSVTNNTKGGISTTLTAITYSVAVTAGGVVVLNGDVIGPSNANTVIKWDNVPLLLGAAPGFGAPVDAAIPIYDAGLNEWRTFALSGAITMNDAGVTTLTPGAIITLNGDVTGPSNANDVVAWSHVPLTQAGPGNFVAPADATIPIYNIGTNKWSALPFTGDVTITDAGLTKVVAWEGVPLDPASMSAPAIGSVPVFTANAPNHWVATPAGSLVITLAGNANGPSNANHVEDFGIESVNTPVTAPQFTPIAAGEWYVGISGAKGDIPVQLQDTFPPGAKVTVKDEDGSLASFDFIVTGSTGKTIDGAPSFIMNLATPGPKGSITFEKNFDANNEWAVV